MGLPFGDNLQDGLFVALRAVAALGSFIAGWLLFGPVARLLWRLAFHRPVPQLAHTLARWTGGILLAILVYMYLPLGWGGGGSGGSGGGSGKGVGPLAGDGGTGAAGQKISSGSEDKKKDEVPVPSKDPSVKEILVVEMLGGEAVKEGKYYLIYRKGPAVNAVELAEFLDRHQHGLLGIDIILTEQSVGESHQAVRLLQSMAQDRKLRSYVGIGKDA